MNKQQFIEKYGSQDELSANHPDVISHFIQMESDLDELLEEKTRKQKVKKISGCNTCPALFCDEALDCCLCSLIHSSKDIGMDINMRCITPDWCPLKQQPIVLKFVP